MSDDPYELATKLYREVGVIIASPVPQETDQPLDQIAAVRAIGGQTTAMSSAAVADARRSESPGTRSEGSWE